MCTSDMKHDWNGGTKFYLNQQDFVSNSAFFKDSSVVGQNCQRAHFSCPPPLRWYVIAEGVSPVLQAQVTTQRAK
jgi:hypothetical protein